MKNKVSAAVLAAVAMIALALGVVPSWAADKPATHPDSSLTVLHTFTNTPDCSQPNAALIKDSAGNMYGTTWQGGAYEYGCVFELSPDGQGGWTYNVIYSLTGGSDGAFPEAPLALDSQGNLYGTTVIDGVHGNGTVFEISKANDGSWYLNKSYLFDNSFGSKPFAGVTVDANGNVFGATHSDFGAGNAPYGAIFQLTPNGNSWTGQALYVFPEDGLEGEYPDGTPIMDRAGNLYGTTNYGGQYGDGTVYRLHPTGNGWVLTTLHNFAGGTSDGKWPLGALMSDAYGNLYSTTSEGGPGSGPGGAGGIFKLSQWPTARQATSANGQWQITWLYWFTGGADGYGPIGPPAFDNAGNLYGTSGSPNGNGLIYKLTPSGTGWSESVPYTFTGGSDGSGPWSPPVFDNAGNLYGVTDTAGEQGCGYVGEGCGTVFKLTQ